MNQTKLTEKQAIKFMKDFDWKGLSEAYNKSQISWNADNWRSFIEKVYEEGKEEGKQEQIIEFIGSENSIDYSGTARNFKELDENMNKFIVSKINYHKIAIEALENLLESVRP